MTHQVDAPKQSLSSHLEWLGTLPTHWSCLPNRAIFAEVIERNRQSEEMLSVTIKHGVVRQKTLLADSSKKDGSRLDKAAYKLVKPYDLVYNKMRAWQGAVGMSELQGIVSPAYIILRLRHRSNLSRYFHYLYRTPAFAKEAERWSYGITSDMWSLRPQHFRMIYSPVPPPDEQGAIVRYLDWATGQMERAIRAKKKIIALLNEQKQAIIHRAVTRGLDPSVPLKPSGIPWLGDIPQHWSVKRLKFLTTHIVDCLHATPPYSEDGEFPAIRTADISPGVVHLRRARKLLQSDYEKWTSRLKPRERDILYAREGERYGIAACVPRDTELCISQRMMVFRVADPNSSEFVMWLLNSQPVYDQASKDVMGATAPHVNVSTIRNFSLAIPEPEGQEKIARSISQETSGLNHQLQRVAEEIKLLDEYRTRLVADVVTGKLDVREPASKLPDEKIPPSIANEDADLDQELEAGEEEEAAS